MFPKRWRKPAWRNMHVSASTADGAAGRKPQRKTTRSYNETLVMICCSSARLATACDITRT
jgi:hypothetical protein